MAELWPQIEDDFNRLYLALSRELDGSRYQINFQGELNEFSEIPWDKISETYRRKGNYPESLVRMALASDCLHHLGMAILADHRIEEHEFDVSFSMALPLASSICTLSRFKRYGVLDRNQWDVFLSAFMNDRQWFGGNCDETRHLSLVLCLIMHHLGRDTSLLPTYERMIRTIVGAVFQWGASTDVERDLVAKLDRMFAICRGNSYPSGNAHRNGKRPSPFDALKPVEPEPPKKDAVEEYGPPGQVLKEAREELDGLIGLDSVKTEVKRLMAYLKIQKQRREHGLKQSSQTLHFVFKGNPGTGKTTVARIIGKILYGFQILKTPKLVEGDRAALVSGYVGQTALKTDELVDSALDGVLFIDEAYALSNPTGQHDFGQEAINTLLKRMEDNRDQLVVIVAGYPRLMQEFIKTNPGLESRFTRYIDFDDYAVADLCRIFEKFCSDAQYELTTEARAIASILFTAAYHGRDERFGNARFVRNVFERAVGLHSERLAAQPEASITREDLIDFTKDDIPLEAHHPLKGKTIDLENAEWLATCPGCGLESDGGAKFLGLRVTCRKCQEKFQFPWWQVRPETVGGIDVQMLKPR
ncbi:Stage V sporulation protein K [Bremerella volcania]|uniref:Stage V sporulation protein K n=1 Tax=Bremerella volcania TaxID=2527984 RepID=A0A518CC21_9BACT|nr:AAA family ATPase [Bremerella volcania]QDU76744.1 Stage V sporulation protein K [Bremerella volcania]